MSAIPRNLVGTAGEYLVAALLSSKGWLATVTIKNAPGTDVLAQHQESGALVAIQTKTKTSGPHFRLNKKDERPPSGNEWFVFVDAGVAHLSEARFFVVPRRVVAALVYSNHQCWLATPGQKGQPHNDTPMRAVQPSRITDYESRWDLLLEPADGAPVLVSDAAREGILEWGTEEHRALVRTS